ncbi:hypothetical protein [Candidatus Uabimicrobium amorphum]|uniref:STAS domain-containing protein n=1 Tax=Uabimicrobium amorphum TaxID=2596890 RepID=A0A5S9F2A3_UABAM|nr:hypothetical protein [Candidatus Uabimicrobium amorphum]BBM83258.1 hypothetical protein UABAM_01609 [Candidatus Uabimicrobium amorphum]
MGFIVEVENPMEKVSLFKMQGELDAQAVDTFIENIQVAFDQGSCYFILEAKNLKQVSRDAFANFARTILHKFQGCTFLFCSMNMILKAKIEDHANPFTFFETERGCLDFLGSHLGEFGVSSDVEKTEERCAAATVAMTIPENLRQLVEEEDRKRREKKEKDKA